MLTSVAGGEGPLPDYIVEDAIEPVYDPPVCPGHAEPLFTADRDDGIRDPGEIMPVDGDEHIMFWSDGTLSAICPSDGTVSPQSGGSGGSGETADIDTDSNNNGIVDGNKFKFRSLC